RIAVEMLHVEDADGHPLDVHGSLGTHELHVGDVAIDATARRFEVMRNELGRVQIDAALQLRGRFESPRIGGDLTITAGSVRVDEINGTYAFQRRRFDVVPASSFIFSDALTPEIYTTVTRIIQGVETRVSLFGPMRQPELRLASTPPLDESDVLSLIIFNTSTNQLSAPQQQQLLVRAGTLAAGFLATQVVAAIESEVGLDILEL